MHSTLHRPLSNIPWAYPWWPNAGHREYLRSPRRPRARMRSSLGLLLLLGMFLAVAHAREAGEILELSTAAFPCRGHHWAVLTGPANQ